MNIYFLIKHSWKLIISIGRKFVQKYVYKYVAPLTVVNTLILSFWNRFTNLILIPEQLPPLPSSSTTTGVITILYVIDRLRLKRVISIKWPQANLHKTIGSRNSPKNINQQPNITRNWGENLKRKWIRWAGARSNKEYV